MIEKWYDAFVVGERQVTRGRTITEADVVIFSMVSGDWNPLHSDQVYAEQAQFGRRIAHGMLMLAVASGLTPLQAPYVLAFYGMDRVRFIAPTQLGDTVHVESELVDKQDRDADTGILTFEVAIVNQRREAVAVYQMKLLVGRGEHARTEASTAPAVGTH